jgi:UDP-N-acetylmuramoyl-L-alanyl-D-glutamate--2,6-diaminopimelate ligase
MSRDRSHSPLDLRRLLPDASWIGGDNIEVRGVGVDSRAILPGDTFVALRGARCDGHRFLRDAVTRGARGVIVERAEPELAVPQCIVRDSRVAYAQLCQALEGNPAARLKLIGITGTNGKTTTSILVKSVLEAAGQRVGLIGTIEVFDGNTSIPAALTTPDAAVLARLMRRMVDAGCTHAVMEVSSHALDQRREAGLSFDVAVFTNLTQDHLDYHGDLAAYAEAKGRLFRGLAGHATAVLNSDDSTSLTFAAGCPGRLLSYGVRMQADCMARHIRLCLDGSQFQIDAGSGGCLIRSPLVGEHNVYNGLAAATVASTLGVSWSAIQQGIERVREIPGRFQAVECGQPFKVLVDYAHTPDAIRSVLRSLRQITAGRVLCLFGAGGDRDRTKRPLMAQAAESADMVVVTSDNPRSEDPSRIISDIVTGFRRIQALSIEPDRRTAIQHILRVAEPGDCVVLAGKGHEAYQLIGDQRLPFDDRLVAAEWLSARYGDATETGSETGTGKRHSGAALGRVACGA